MSQNDYQSALLQARRHIEDACYGRPCLNDCLSRLGGTPPLCACAGGRGAPRRGKLLALLVVLAATLLFTFLALADVQCIWDGQTYQCSGVGSRVEVIGGGSGEPVVVTNFWGVCTNCVAMTPSYCNSLKEELGLEISNIEYLFSKLHLDVTDVLLSVIGLKDEILTFRSFGSSSSTTISSSTWSDFTNYIQTVDNTQTRLDLSYISGDSGIAKQRRIGFNDGIYDYALSIVPTLSYQSSALESVDRSALASEERVRSLGDFVSENIDCSECQPEYEPGGSPDGGGGGGGVVTNVFANGNWCTYDQGEALKSLLGDLKTWAQRQHSQLVSISNYVDQSWQTLRSGLYSEYTALPRGEDWQTLYLQGQPTGWGYDPTNVLQRIEVLLYGISGISTNVSERLEDTTPDADDAVDDISDAVSTIATDASDRDAQSLGHAIIGFFRAFTPHTKDYSGGEEILAEVQYSVGNESFYVPSVRLGSSGFLVGTMATVKSFVSGFCSVLFWVGGAFAIFRFWVFFSAWCVKLSKWAVELTTSLFAS